MAAAIHTIAAAFAIVAVALPWSATCDFTLAPLLSPIFGGVCKGGLCGKGNCKESTSAGLGYECECDPGWKQARSQNDSLFKFLPCVIPNCSVDLSCGDGQAPAPAPEKNINTSILEPCHWANCGGGLCNKTGALTYTCICKEGYFNLLNSTGLPCVRECALGMDCKNLGFGLTNNSISPPPPSSSDGTSKACSIMGDGFFWKVIAATLLAIFFMNYMQRI